MEFKKTLKILSLLLFIMATGFSLAEAQSPDNLAVLREAAAWKFSPEEKVTISYFPCSMTQETCKRLKIKDGIYKAYFTDGFVLTLSSSGEVLEHYYLPSEQHKEAFKRNMELYERSGFENLPEEIRRRLKIRVEDMKSFLRGKSIDALSVEELNAGKYREALEKISNLGLKSIISLLLEEPEKAKELALKAKETNVDDLWTKRASALVLLSRNELEELSKGDDIDKLIASITYAKIGDLESSRKAYEAISDNFLSSKSLFAQDLIKTFRRSIAPYLARELEKAVSFQKANKLNESLRSYQVVFSLSDIDGKKKVISQVSSIFKKEPKLREIPEEARKHIVIASMLFERKKLEEALEECRKALQVAPFTPVAFKGLAKCYGALGLYEKAIENMNYYLELSPDAPDARESRDEIYRWEFLLKEKTGSKGS